MQAFLKGPLAENARNSMRRLGYGEHVGHGGQLSYVRRLTSSEYPHYHAYVEDRDGGIQVNLHLDQKPANLGSGAMHSGEYDGPLVVKEMERVRGLINSWKTSAAPAQSEPEEKKGFWGSLFG
jgi:hypothetical protein